MNNLRELFEDTVKDLYNAERQFLKAMPKLIEAVENERLKSTIQDHFTQSQGHLTRLEQLAAACEFKPTGKVCKAAQGLVEETNEHLEELKTGPTLDSAIILCAQKNEHYEICSYGTLVAWSKTLGLNRATDLLSQTLQEEEVADDLLSKAAGPILPIAMELPVVANAH